MNITPNDKIGYIRKSQDKNGKDIFTFIEAKIKKIVVGKNRTSVYSDKLYALNADELISNTKIVNNKYGIMFVGEPFITTKEYSERCRKTIEYWNIHGAEKYFD